MENNVNQNDTKDTNINDSNIKNLNENSDVNNQNNINSNQQKSESDSGKGLAILSYFGILSLISFFSEKNNSFVVFHAKQGLNLFLLEIIGYFAASIVGRIMHMSYLLVSAVELCAFILSIIGIIAAAQGEKKELPIVSSIKIIK